MRMLVRSLSITFGALLLLSACTQEAQPPLPTPIATFEPLSSSSSPGADGASLPAEANLAPICDGSPDVEITCSADGDVLRVETSINAGVFSRWSLPLSGITGPLTGNETLQLHMRSEGDVRPNLYLADGSGRRISVALGEYGLNQEWRTVSVPLREVRNQADEAPDWADLQALEIVFEWSDMAGAVEIDKVDFAPVWTEEVGVQDAAQALAAGLGVPSGFTATAMADRLFAATQIVFTPEGDLLVSLQNGRVWRYHDADGDGVYDARSLYDSGYIEVVGLLFDSADGAVWLGGRGQLIRTLDADGDGAADTREVRLDGLPWGRHQNNGLAWNPDPDPFTGEAGASWLYFGLGSTEDLLVGGEWNATVLRFPRDGAGVEDLEIVSRGNRNAYMVAWGRVPTDLSKPEGEAAWQLFAGENGPDFNDAPDEVNHIRLGHDYGFPDQFGPVEPPEADGAPFSGPIYPVTPHASASGLAYISNPAWPAEYRTLYVSLFGQVFSEGVVGHTVERIALEEVETAAGPTYRGTPSDFITGLDRPLPMAVGPEGNLWVGDYATGVIYRISR
ncbi:MAG: hypothetical protein H6642_07335 [Caldilineaceae bacterium]|nr:hypothetical protein [Caldilineaceae bacterium]